VRNNLLRFYPIVYIATIFQGRTIELLITFPLKKGTKVLLELETALIYASTIKVGEAWTLEKLSPQLLEMQVLFYFYSFN